MPTPTTPHPTTRRRLSGLTPKGRATVALLAVRDRWDSLSPSQQAECAELLGRLSVALRGEPSVADRAPSPVRVPLVGRIVA